MRMLCKTTDTSDGYNYAFIDIDAARAKELLALQPLWEQVHTVQPSLYCFEVFDETPEWFDHVQMNETVETTVESREWAIIPEDGEDAPEYGESYRTCAETLVITHSGVLWSASPKHSEGYFETLEITWAMLEKIAAQ